MQKRIMKHDLEVTDRERQVLALVWQPTKSLVPELNRSMFLFQELNQPQAPLLVVPSINNGFCLSPENSDRAPDSVSMIHLGAGL